jgi:hypothetical protein
MRFLLPVLLALTACSSDPVSSSVAPPSAPPSALSTQRLKRDIRYIDDLDAFALRDDVVGLRLATFHYASEPTDAQAHLGFIIEDSPALLAIDHEKRSVDLYSYTSMAIAAIQVQQAEIEALREELHVALKNRSECSAHESASAR